MTTTWADTMEYLEGRADRHGLSFYDLMDMTPSSVADCPHETMVFWKQRDISHEKSQFNHPELADDPSNVMPEDPYTNRERGSDDMTEAEIATAKRDNEILAREIDLEYKFDQPEPISSPTFTPFDFFLF